MNKEPAWRLQTHLKNRVVPINVSSKQPEWKHSLAHRKWSQRRVQILDKDFCFSLRAYNLEKGINPFVLRQL